MDLSFLNNVELAPVVKGTSAGKTAQSKTPTNGADIRVTKSGKVYPSAEYVAAANLEYQKSTDENPKGGNGLDIFSSLEWGMLMDKLPTELLFIAQVPKVEAKVDLFSSCGFEGDGTPKATALTQGGGSFGKRLAEMIATVYAIDWETTDHVDLKVGTEVIESSNKLYAIPKVVSSGPKKGEATYQTRKDLVINPLVIFEQGETANVPPAAEANTEVIADETVKQMEVVAETVAPPVVETVVDADAEVVAEADNPFFAKEDEVIAEEPTVFEEAVPGVDPLAEQAADPGADWADGLGQDKGI